MNFKLRWMLVVSLEVATACSKNSERAVPAPFVPLKLPKVGLVITVPEGSVVSDELGATRMDATPVESDSAGDTVIAPSIGGIDIHRDDAGAPKADDIRAQVAATSRKDFKVESFADGFEVTYETHSPTATLYWLEMHRKIGVIWYRCKNGTASLPERERAQGACKSLAHG